MMATLSSPFGADQPGALPPDPRSIDGQKKGLLAGGCGAPVLNFLLADRQFVDLPGQFADIPGEGFAQRDAAVFADDRQHEAAGPKRPADVAGRSGVGVDNQDDIAFGQLVHPVLQQHLSLIHI